MFVGTVHGIGQRLYEAYMTSVLESLYAYLMIVGFFGYTLIVLLARVERRYLGWVGK